MIHTAAATRKKKRKPAENTADDVAYSRALEVLQKPIDSYQTYGDYVASELREMTEINRKRAKLEISRILLKYAEIEATASASSVEVVQPTNSGIVRPREYYESSQEWVMSNNGESQVECHILPPQTSSIIFPNQTSYPRKYTMEGPRHDFPRNAQDYDESQIESQDETQTSLYDLDT